MIPPYLSDNSCDWPPVPIILLGGVIEGHLEHARVGLKDPHEAMTMGCFSQAGECCSGSGGVKKVQFGGEARTGVLFDDKADIATEQDVSNFPRRPIRPRHPTIHQRATRDNR